MPVKTTLAILTFMGLILLPRVAPALKNYESLRSAESCARWWIFRFRN